MNVYILTEITKRELDSNLLLSILAAEENGEVLISNMSNLEYLNKKKLLKSGILHTKSLVHDKRKQDFHLSLVKNNILITSLDEENGLVKKNLKNFAERRFSEEALKLADKVFCWGRDDLEMLKKKYAEYEEKFILSGAPRTDMWSKKFISYWKDENETKETKDTVLISTNFGLVNGQYTMEEILKREKKAGYFDRCKESKNEMLQIYENSKLLIVAFEKLINFLSKEFPNIEFHVRPHPREKISTWKKMIKERSNVNISNEGNINSNLCKAKILLHNNCTTAFQASMYELPIISYSPLEDETDNESIANHLGTILKTEVEVKKYIEEIIDKKEIIPKNRKKILERKLYIPKDVLCTKNIINTWKNLMIDKYNKNNWNLIILNIRIYNFYVGLKKFIFQLFYSNKNVKIDEKFEKIDTKKIENKIHKFKKILNINSNFSVIKIANRAFLIKKKLT